MYSNLENKIIKNTHIILGFFLLLIGVMGNYIAETLGCKMRKLLRENMFAKNIVVILIIYFVIGFTSDPLISPTRNIGLSLIIWIMFLLFNKTRIEFTLIASFILILLLLSKNYMDHYKAKDKNKYSDRIKKLRKTIVVLAYIFFIIISIGFIIYLSDKYEEYYDNFSFVSFMFGKVNCKSIKYAKY